MSETIAKPLPTPRRPWKSVLFLAGVAAPTASLVVELLSHWCASILFDPIPSFLHILLVATMPIANLAVLLAIHSRTPRRLGALSALNAISIGISLFYSILFAPVSPIAAIGIIVYGIGLLPLGPLFSLVAAIRLRIHLKRLANEEGAVTSFWPGFLLSLCLLMGADLPSTTTRIGLQLATSDSPELRDQAIRWLRLVGSKKTLLRHCYGNNTAPTDLVGTLFMWSDPIAPEQAQSIYYRVTGKAYNTEPPPPLRERRGGWRSGLGNFDMSQGSASVGGQLRELQLSASRMDGSFDAEAAVAYLEWTMVFKNDSPLQREARAQIAMPPGAVISRLTLWVNGEEREAAFAGKREVRAAYEKVVRQQRDPVLVTSAGQDRALVQLFPVPPHGEMKVRIGISVPALTPNNKESVLQLPYFHEKNFALPAGFTHALWVDSKAALHSGNQQSVTANNRFSLRTTLDDAQLTTADARIIAPRTGEGISWAQDSKASGFLIRQSLNAVAGKAPKHLVVVADASIAMREAIPQLTEQLKRLPGTTGITLIFAEENAASTTLPPEQVDAITLARRLGNFSYSGGHSNLRGLTAALKLALQQDDSAILWLHGPQPVYPGSVEDLLQASEPHAKLPPLYDLQLTPGGNQIVEALDGRWASTSLNLQSLEALVASWQVGARSVTRTLERLTTARGEFNLLREKTSDHLARLWANEEIHRQMADPAKRTGLIALAQRYQLVTPISGAVVLETQQQYDEAGLTPVQSGSVPTIPEPETWMLISVALGALAWQARRNKRKASNETL